MKRTLLEASLYGAVCGIIKYKQSESSSFFSSLTLWLKIVSLCFRWAAPGLTGKIIIIKTQMLEHILAECLKITQSWIFTIKRLHLRVNRNLRSQGHILYLHCIKVNALHIFSVKADFRFYLWRNTSFIWRKNKQRNGEGVKPILYRRATSAWTNERPPKLRRNYCKATCLAGGLKQCRRLQQTTKECARVHCAEKNPSVFTSSLTSLQNNVREHMHFLSNTKSSQDNSIVGAILIIT